MKILRNCVSIIVFIPSEALGAPAPYLRGLIRRIFIPSVSLTTASPLLKGLDKKV